MIPKYPIEKVLGIIDRFISVNKGFIIMRGEREQPETDENYVATNANMRTKNWTRKRGYGAKGLSTKPYKSWQPKEKSIS